MLVCLHDMQVLICVCADLNVGVDIQTRFVSSTGVIILPRMEDNLSLAALRTTN